MTTPPPARPARRRMPTRRRVLVIVTALLIMAVVGVASLLALDVYLHHRVQYDAGVNVWGYRGPVIGKKKPGERRIIVIGGSTAFGYGMRWNEAFPYYLEQKLNAREYGTANPVSVVNLGIPTDSARTFVATLNDYAYLDYDIAIFYEGYNDLGLDVNPPPNMTNPAVSHYLAWRHQSPIFRWTGYFPIFPLVLSEKSMVLLHGNLNAAYGNDIVFRPSLTSPHDGGGAQVGGRHRRRDRAAFWTAHQHHAGVQRRERGRLRALDAVLRGGVRRGAVMRSRTRRARSS